MGVVTRDVKSLSKSGDTKLKGDVTLSEGANITITQSGQDIEIAASGGSGATTALDNLASVAINTSLISDTDVTDDLGSLSIRWNNVYAATLSTGDTASDTLKLRGYDVDGATFVDILTITANNTVTADLHPSVTIGGNTILDDTSTTSALTTVGTISTGTWQGTAIANTYGGTGQDTSSSTGVAQVSSGTWSVSTALADGTTATTQSAGDNSTKVATTAYVDAAAGGGGNYSSFSTVFEAEGRFETTETSGGTVTFSGEGCVLTTTTTAGSRCGNILDFTAAPFYDFSVDSHFGTTYRIDTGGDNQSYACVLGTVSISSGGIGLTGKHYGFEYDESSGTSNHYATNANGTTQTQTSINTSATLFGGGAVFDAGTDIKFYDAGTLDATHTTNLPSGGVTAGNVIATAMSNKNNADGFVINTFVVTAGFKIN